MSTIVHIYIKLEVLIWKKGFASEAAFLKLFNFQGVPFANGFSKLLFLRESFLEKYILLSRIINPFQPSAAFYLETSQNK